MQDAVAPPPEDFNPHNPPEHCNKLYFKDKSMISLAKAKRFISVVTIKDIFMIKSAKIQITYVEHHPWQIWI